MQNLADQKAQAIAVHSQQAPLFASRYGVGMDNPFRDCFAYSRRRLQVLLDRYLPAKGEGLRLLDVGCGTGHHMAALRERGYAVAGVDGSLPMVEQARALNPQAEVLLADVERLPFADASFDIVICIEVLRYLPSNVPCLHEMARVLKPGGVCLATAAPLFNLNAYWLVNRLAHLAPVGNLTRLKQFFTTGPRLRRQFMDAGFLSPSVHGVYFGPINWAQRLTPRLLPRLLRAWEGLDRRLADRPVIREFSNMFLAVAQRRG